MCSHAVSEERLDMMTPLQQASCLIQPWVFISFSSKIKNPSSLEKRLYLSYGKNNICDKFQET